MRWPAGESLEGVGIGNVGLRANACTRCGQRMIGSQSTNQTVDRPRVALLNVWSDHNRGDAAIVHATCEAILRRQPKAIVDLHNVVFGAEDTRRQMKGHFGSFENSPYRVYPALFPSMIVSEGKPRVSQAVRLVYLLRAILILVCAALGTRWGRVIVRKQEREAFDALTRCDCAISKGGSYLLGNSWKGVIQISMVMFPLVLAKMSGAKTSLLGVSVGPARSRVSAWTMKLWFRWVDSFVLREQNAYDTCVRLGVPEHKMVILPDMAFLLKIHEDRPPAEPAILAGLDRPRIAVTVRRWSFADLAPAQRDEQERTYLSSVAEALVAFHAETNASILLVPQVVGPGRQGSDLDALDIVERLVGGRAQIVRLPDDLDYMTLRAVYTHVDMLIGTRLHSVILAFGTPTVIIGYQGDKSIGTARLLGNERGFVHINDVNTTLLLDRMRTVWRDRDQLRTDAARTKIRFKSDFAQHLDPLLDRLLHVGRRTDRKVAAFESSPSEA